MRHWIAGEDQCQMKIEAVKACIGVAIFLVHLMLANARNYVSRCILFYKVEIET